MMNILLPSDFSENAQRAADFVFEMFDPAGFRLIIVHGVVPPRPSPGMMINITDLMQKDADRDLLIEKTRLEEKYDGIGRIETHSKLGYLQDVLPTFCTTHNADLVVMGTRGDNTFASKVLGSNTEHIVRLGFAPILAVPAQVEVGDAPKICIATAKTEIPHVEVLEKIFKNLKNKLSSRISVLHVLTNNTDKALKSLALDGMQIHVETEIADTAEDGINAYLAKEHVDMLVVCHRHNARIDYLFSRSTTKKLTGQIQVPLMILPGWLPVKQECI
ncbi:MAG: nucleotide-binding universal stress UspA family protein [Bacteroidia bacterium]|jgi:nucleotide-binding universal stress UspA family protein